METGNTSALDLGGDSFDLSYEAQLKCVRREIGLREACYPRWVKAGTMKQEKATLELATMRAVQTTLEDLLANGKARPAMLNKC
jgi:hypothetical protein